MPDFPPFTCPDCNETSTDYFVWGRYVIRIQCPYCGEFMEIPQWPPKPSRESYGATDRNVRRRRAES